MKIMSDNPIRNAEEDRLGRVDAAKHFATQALSLDASEGIVVGVLGAWGSGKTSFINLARSEFERSGATILDFNPWMFSGAEQLIDRFFIELSAQLRIKPGYTEIADSLADYGEAISGLTWLPVLGPWLERAKGIAKLISSYLKKREEGTDGRRSKLESALSDLEYPILVVLDDIDRLSSAEIREVFKLIRLTASFPNIVYIVAFDRYRVEDALSDLGVPGRDYLEKILQVAVDLPVIPSDVLNRQILLAIDSVLTGIDNPGPFDAQAWPDVFMEIVRPLIRNMRDVRRYTAALRGTVIALDGQIALADVLALEAIRTFLPDVYSQFYGAMEGLTATSGISSGDRTNPPHLKASIDSLIEVSQPRQEIIRSMIKRLFPAADRHIGGSHFGIEWQGRWLRDRRVAHKDILRLYLERIVGKGLQAFTDAEHAFSVMSDRVSFDRYLRSLDIERLEDVISSLEAFEDRFAPEHAVPGIIVLLNLLPSIPERPRGMLEFDSGLIVGRVIYRLLRAFRDSTDIEVAVKEILPELTTLSSKFELITDVGYREGAGHKFVSEDFAAKLEKSWREEVRAASPSDLERERNLLTVLRVAKKDATPEEPLLEISDDPELTLAILRAAKKESRSQSIDSRAIRRSSQLAWDSLVEIFGSQDELNNRIHNVKETNPEDEDELFGLIDRYFAGWRPSDFDDD